jgi:hypothetical protein
MELTLGEVEEMAKALGLDADGKVKLQAVKDLLLTKTEPALEEKEVVDCLTPAIFMSGAEEGTKLEDCSVSPADLQWVLTHGTKARSLRATRRTLMQERHEINVNLLNDTVVKITNRHDAFMTLPITACYMFVFVALVTSHLRIHTRQYSEKALEDWVNGRDPRTDCENNVDTMEAFWEWLLGEEDGIRGVMGIERRAVSNSNWTQYKLAHHHCLLGDLKLSYMTYDGATNEKWLLKTTTGESMLLSGNDYKESAVQSAASLQADSTYRWDSSNIEKLQLRFTTFNERARMFGLTSVTITFFEWGSLFAKINSEVVSVEAYPTPLCYVWQALFSVIIFYMAFMEGKDMFHALMLGCGEFLDYWQFWNCVDWICILLGFALMCMWVACGVAMQSDSLSAIIDKDGTINQDVMAMDEDSVTNIMTQVDALQMRFRFLHFIIAANTVSMVAKFFKAFSSNPRLKVVTDTFSEASTDFAHFFIIFFTLFLPFTIIGHVLFGNDIEEFGSMTAAFNTGVTVLMGDFEWYIDATSTATIYGETAFLPSGVPVILLSIWFVSYMFLVFLVLLNILLAIIIKHQTEVDGRLESQTDAYPIWTQVAKYLEFRRKTKGFKYSLEHIRRMLENDDDPAHGDDREAEVNEETLQVAFKDMSEEQARYHMEVLREEVDKRKSLEDKEADQNSTEKKDGSFHERDQRKARRALGDSDDYRDHRQGYFFYEEKDGRPPADPGQVAARSEGPVEEDG